MSLIELDDASIFETIENEAFVFIDFYASWCGACRVAAPMFMKVAESEGIKLFKIDVEKNPKIKAMLELPGLPSIGCFKLGEPKGIINTTKEEALREFILEMKKD